MDRLHSYWRIPYIEAPKTDSNVKGDFNPFLEMTQTDDFKKFHILWRGKYSFIVMNKFPYNCGHLLVLPLREVADIELLEDDEKIEFFNAIIKGKRILRLAMNPDAFNVGFNLGEKAGAGVPQAMDTLWEKLVKFVDA